MEISNDKSETADAICCATAKPQLGDPTLPATRQAGRASLGENHEVDSCFDDVTVQ